MARALRSGREAYQECEARLLAGYRHRYVTGELTLEQYEHGVERVLTDRAFVEGERASWREG